MSLGIKIKKLRKEQKLSQGELSKRSGVHEKLISKYENERIFPTADTLKKIAQALNISTDYLVFENVPKEGTVELNDPELFNRFRQVEQMGEEEQETIKKVIDAMVIKNKVEKAVNPDRTVWSKKMTNILTRCRSKAKGYSEEEIMNIVEEAVDAVRNEDKEERKAS